MCVSVCVIVCVYMYVCEFLLLLLAWLMDDDLLFVLQIICWNLPRQALAKKVQAHEGIVHGLAAHKSGRYFFSVSIIFFFF